MASDSGQKQVGRNRPPRVQIEYDVETYGSAEGKELPFVMGVLSDLAGKSKDLQPLPAQRKFSEIDADNFDAYMKSTKPRVAFPVPNLLTGEGNLAVDITFTKMDDFSPAAIASKVEGLRELFEARKQLANLLAYMDGKAPAENLLRKLITDKALLNSLQSVKPAAPADPAA
jgi:type VI secretion system protein ImpB